MDFLFSGVVLASSLWLHKVLKFSNNFHSNNRIWHDNRGKEKCRASLVTYSKLTCTVPWENTAVISMVIFSRFLPRH